MEALTAYPAVPGPRLSRLQWEAQCAVAGLDARDWLELAAFCFSAAVVGTIQTKATGLARVAGAVGRKIHETLRSVRFDGLATTAHANSTMAAEATSASIRRIRGWIEQFMDLPPEGRRELLVDTAITAAAAYLIAGGADAEGGMADLDLLLGVGFHRNAFSHTILAPLAAETGLRFTAAVIARLHRRLPEGHDPVWDQLLSASKRVFEATIVGVWLGMAVHLLNDVGMPWSGTKPITGMPMSLSMAGHQALLAANASTAGAMAALTGIGRRRKYTTMS